MAASSENPATGIDPFILRQSFSDCFWPAPADNDTLTKALEQSLYANHDYDHDFDLLLLPPQQPVHNQYQNRSFSPFSSSDLEQHHHHQQQLAHPTLSASDPETSTTPKRRTTSVDGKARIAKRKSRATKKNQTTFITADPANFRQMVQQVTGIRFDASPLPPLSHLLKPETRRPVGRLYNACLPTLDTSSFLLDHQSQSDRPIYSSAGVAQSANAEAGYGASDGLSSFPTLESWKVM